MYICFPNPRFKPLSLIVAVIALASSPANGQNSAVDNLVRIENEEFGYSVLTPADWLFDVETSPMQIRGNSQDGSLFVSLTVTPDEENVGLATREFVSSLLSLNLEPFILLSVDDSISEPEVEEIGSTYVVFPAAIYALISGVVEDDTGELVNTKVAVYSTRNGNYMYHLAFSCLSSDFDEAKPLFDTLAAGFATF